MRSHGLRDDQWDLIKDLLSGRPGMVVVTAADNRLFVEVVLYRLRAGIPWRDLSDRFGDCENAFAVASGSELKPVPWGGYFSSLPQRPTTNTR